MPNDGDPMQTCGDSWGTSGTIFRPREADATIQNPGDAWFWKNNHAFWNASQVWDHVMLTWGRGDNFILNMPPDTTGQIPQKYVDATTAFGNAFRATFQNPVAASSGPKTANCSAARIEIQVPKGATIDAFVAREDMSQLGQQISSYQVLANVNGNWVDVNATYGGGIHGVTIGSRVVDFTGQPITGATAVAVQCLTSVRDPVTLRDFKALKSQRPA